MFHLLPEINKKKLQGEYHSRVWLVSLVLLNVAVVAGGILLVPSFILSQSKNSFVEQKSASLKAQVAQQTSSTTANLASTQQMIAVLAPENQISFATLIKNVEAEMPASVSINSFFFNQPATGTFDLTLAGTAQSREGLVALQQALEKDPAFASVELPISNFAKDTNINFSIHVIGK